MLPYLFWSERKLFHANPHHLLILKMIVKKNLIKIFEVILSIG